MIVRHATREDIPRIVEMAGLFYADTSYAAIVPMAEEMAAGLAIVMMDTGVMLVAEDEGRVVGMVGLIVEPFTFNMSATMASEIVFWVEPTAQRSGIGRQFITAIEQPCRGRGVNIIVMKTLATSPPQARAIYESEGYYASEHAFTKVLN